MFKSIWLHDILYLEKSNSYKHYFYLEDSDFNDTIIVEHPTYLDRLTSQIMLIIPIIDFYKNKNINYIKNIYLYIKYVHNDQMRCFAHFSFYEFLMHVSTHNQDFYKLYYNEVYRYYKSIAIYE